MAEINWLEVALSGTDVCSMGQIDATWERRLNAAAKRGELVKWRGYWSSGHDLFGIGPLKNWWGLPR